MCDNIKLGDIVELYNELVKGGMPKKDALAIPIYLSDDDELNGIHTCFSIGIIDSENDKEFVEEMINGSGYNVPLPNGSKAILL